MCQTHISYQSLIFEIKELFFVRKKRPKGHEILQIFQKVWDCFGLSNFSDIGIHNAEK